ncbi:L-ribulose-5-phosphate 4-epimerase UlaF [compost metagenome]
MAAAIENAQVLEFLARLECRILAMGDEVDRPEEYLINKHYRRKHGPSKYYGQP